MKSHLTHRLSQSEIKELCAKTQGEHNDDLKEKLYLLTMNDDRRVAINALWVFTHFAAADNEWRDVTKLRLILSLLLRQPFYEDNVRTDFIDFCLVRLADPKSPYAIRALCIKLAYEQMRYWPELLNELRQTLDMISRESLSPGLRSAWGQVVKKICKSGSSR